MAAPAIPNGLQRLLPRIRWAAAQLLQRGLQ